MRQRQQRGLQQAEAARRQRDARTPHDETRLEKKKTGALERLPVSMRIKRKSKTSRIGRSDPGAQPGAHFPPGPLGPYFFFAAVFLAGAFFAGAFFAGAFFAAALAIFILPLQSVDQCVDVRISSDSKIIRIFERNVDCQKEFCLEKMAHSMPTVASNPQKCAAP